MEIDLSSAPNDQIAEISEPPVVIFHEEEASSEEEDFDDYEDDPHDFIQIEPAYLTNRKTMSIPYPRNNPVIVKTLLKQKIIP